MDQPNHPAPTGPTERQTPARYHRYRRWSYWRRDTSFCRPVGAACCSPSNSRGFHPWLLTVAPLGLPVCSPSNSRGRPVGAASSSPSNSRGFHPWLLTVAPLGLQAIDVVLRSISDINGG